MMNLNYCNSSLYTDECNHDFYNLVTTILCILFIIIPSIYAFFFIHIIKLHLHYLHDLRTLLVIFLIIVNICEISQSCLSLHPPDDARYRITSPLSLYSACLYLISTVTVTAFIRIIEVRNKPDWIILSAIVQVVQVISKCYKLWYLTNNAGILTLKPFLLLLSTTLVLSLGVLDGLIFLEKSSKKLNESTIINDNIGYKQPYSTFLSKITFWWLTPLLWKGYLEPLELEHLGNLDEKDTSRFHYDQFLFIYQSHKNTSLWICYIKSCWKFFLIGGLLKLLGDLTGLCGPLSISFIVQYISNKSNSSNYITFDNETDIAQVDKKFFIPDWQDYLQNGWIICVLVFLSSLAQGTLSQGSSHLINMEGIKLKNALQGLIYRKTLQLNSSCFSNKNHSNEDSDNSESFEKNDRDTNRTQISTDAGAITNLMSEDTFNVMSFFLIAHYVWAIPLKIIIVMYLLYLKLGVSAVIGSVCCIMVMTPLQFLIGKMMSANAKIASECTDDRLKRINEVLLGIKLIKLNAWDHVFKERINESRRNEIKHLNVDSVLWTLMTFLTHVSTVLITFVTFAIFMSIDDDGNKFTASNVFTALALFNQLTVPLFIFPITVPIIIAAVLSTKRLENFLGGQEVQKEFEGVRNMARILSKSDASLDIFEDENNVEGDSDTYTLNEFDQKSIQSDNINIRNSLTLTNVNNNRNSSDSNVAIEVPAPIIIPTLIHIKKQTLNHPHPKKTKLRKSQQLTLSCKMERNRLRQRSLSGGNIKDIQINTISDDHAVTIDNGVYNWNTGDAENTLNIQKLVIPKAKLTVIVGRNGSGKSSLLAALLKEMNYVSGEVKWNKYSTIAYVPQHPWLMNATVRDNILFGESYRPKRYERVLKACALKPDIESMPQNDITEIGERGINLSGGQRQRITIARALYSSANVVIMDDPLSSLDNEVGKYLFENGIKNFLVKHNRTTILVTQKLQLVYNAENIIVMENNKIKAIGTLAEIENNDAEIVQEWNSVINSENSNESSAKVTRGWKLLKNISRLGFHRNNTADDESLSLTKDLYKPKKRLTSVYGSRYLSHDLPVPIDVNTLNENVDNVELRRQPSRRFFNSLEYAHDHKNVIRVSSLQPNTKLERNSVKRHISSPTELNRNSLRLSSSGEENSIDNVGKIGFRQFLRRVSSRRKYLTNPPLGLREKFKLQGSVPENINEEETHIPVSRLISNNSKYSEDTEEDTCMDFNTEELSNQLIYDEERKYGEIPNQVYWLYLKSCGLPIVSVFFASAFLLQGIKVYTDVWLQNWTEINSDKEEVKYYFKMYGFLSGICILLSAVTTPAGQICGNSARTVLHNKLIDSVFKHSLHYLQSIPLGRLMNRFSFDMSVIDKKIAATSQRLLQFILLCLCAVLINTAVTPWFILLTLPICLIYYLIQKFFRYSSRELQRIESITSSPVLTHFSETIQGVTTIRAYNQESRFMEMLFKKMEANNVAFISLNCSNRWLGIALDYLGGVIVFVAIITSLITNHLYPETTTSSLVGLAINYTLLVPIYLNWVVKLLADMEMYFGAVERVQSYFDIANLEHTLIYKPVPISWPQKGDISFENVSLRYEDQKENVVTDFTLYIPAGQRIGICGRTASGKSSLAMSLFGVLQITNGRIMIDDVDISTIHLDELRSRLSIIPQDVILFSGTIRDNLDPRGHFSDLELWNCIEIAQLKDILNSQSLGLDTQIVDGGYNFSTGQRQLFCLARAVLRGSVCLVLDEATSSLDTETELALLKAACIAFQGRTIITIAHRLHSLLDYDRVIVLENGRIIEDGNPNELKNNASSKFATMIKASEALTKNT